MGRGKRQQEVEIAVGWRERGREALDSDEKEEKEEKETSFLPSIY
jgi:hypothetical protein